MESCTVLLLAKQAYVPSSVQACVLHSWYFARTHFAMPLLVHSAKRHKVFQHGNKYPHEWRRVEYHLRQVSVQTIGGPVPWQKTAVKCYTDCGFFKTTYVQRLGEAETKVSCEPIMPHVQPSKNKRVDLRVWVPWLKRKIVYSRLVAFHWHSSGMTWRAFHKLAPRKKGYYWVADHLKPLPRWGVGKKWSRCCFIDCLEIVDYRENARREASNRS